jgi:hypothetical protein|tara:strand:+ start:5641 stop:6027 length:387 start_codon:yes stop_codon:yes gene_type:complete
MSLYDKIIELFEEEVNQRIVSIMNEYVTIISKKHGISLDLLLKDIPEIFSGTICKGTKNDGRRCTFRGTNNGYCRHHAAQYNRLEHVHITRNVTHTHGPEKMFVDGCPGCSISKELIDLNTMIGNEQI